VTTTSSSTQSPPDSASTAATVARPSGFFVGCALVAVVCISSPLHLPLNNPNEGVRVFATKALVEQRTTTLDDVVAQWGFIDDKARHNGHVYSSKAPLVTLLASGAYALVHPLSGDLPRVALTRFCRVTGSVLPTFLCLALLYNALKRRVRDAFLVEVAVVGLVTGTGVLAALHVFSGHALVAATAAALTAQAIRPDAPTPTRLVVMGTVWSTAACAEYPAALLAPLCAPVVLAAPRRLTAVALVALGAFLAAIPTLVVHTVSFGAPWRTGYSFLDNPHYRSLVSGTFMGIGAPDFHVLSAALFSTEVGLFFFAPLCLLGVVALPRLARREKSAALAIVVVVVCFLGFIAGFRGWRGGWSVGPRYLSELWGILVVVAVVGLDGVAPALLRPAFTLCTAVGVLHSGLAGALFPHLPDNLKNPVVEMVFPLWVRGIAPDSLPLALGLSPGASVVVIAVVLALPVVLIALRHAPRTLGVVALLPPWIAFLGVLPGSDADVRGREVRRALDNWRPENGVPYFDDGPTDPRVLFAVDRGRLALLPIDCSSRPPRQRRADSGEGGRLLRRAVLPDAGLVVVADALADAIAPLGGGALLVTLRDVALTLRGSLPCTGDIVVVARRQAVLPAVLRALSVRSVVDLGDGWQKTTFARGEDRSGGP
jgi:hypothetical protein